MAGAGVLEVAGGGGATLAEVAVGGVEVTVATVVDGREEVDKMEVGAAVEADCTDDVLNEGAFVEDAIATGVLVAKTGLSTDPDGADTWTTLDVVSVGAAPAVTQMVFTTFSVCVTMSQSVT